MGSNFLERINVRFLVILLGVGIGLLALVVVVNYFQRRGHATYFLEEAEKAAEKESILERQKALENYGKYLSFNQNATEVRAKYGLLLAELMQYPQAIDVLERVMREDSEHVEARKGLVDIYINPMIRRYSDALDHLEILKATKPEDAEILELYGQCSMAQENDIEAEEAFRKAIEKDPHRLSAYMNLSTLLENRMSNAEGAQEILDKMIEVNPDSVEAYCKRGRSYLSKGDLKNGQADIQKALELKPEDEKALLLAAEGAIKEKDYAKSREYAKKVIELYPESAQGYLNLAVNLHFNKEPEEAVKVLEQGLKKTGGAAQLLWHKADILLGMQKTEQARETILELRKKRFPNMLIDFLEAELDFANQKWLDASKKFENVRSKLEGVPSWSNYVQRSNFFLAQCYKRLGRPELEKQTLSRLGQPRILASAQKADPYLQAKLLFQKGELDNAIKEYRLVLDSDRATPEGWIGLTQLLMAQQLQIEDASERKWTEVDLTIAKAAENLPGDPRISNLLAQVLAAKDKLGGAEGELRSAVNQRRQEYQRWRKVKEGVVQAADSQAAIKVLDEAMADWAKDNPVLQEAKVELQEDKQKEAIKLIRKAMRTDFDRTRLWLNLVRLAEKKGDLARTEVILDEAVEDMGDQTIFRLARARLWFQQDPDEATKKIPLLLENLDQFSESNRQMLWSNVALLASRAGKLKEAVRLCRLTADAQPNNLQLREWLFDLALRAGEMQEVEKTLEEVRGIEGEGPHWNYLKAVEMVQGADQSEKEKFDAALVYLEKARLQSPTWERVPAFEGRVYDLQGNREAAINSYTKAVDLGMKDTEVITRLVQLLTLLGRQEEGGRFIQMIPEETSDLSYQTLYLKARERFRRGEDALGIRDMKRVAESLRKVLPESKDVYDYIRLSEALRLIAQASPKNSSESKVASEESVKVLRQAIQMEPTSLVLWSQIIKTLRQFDLKEDIEKTIEEAKKQLGPKELPLVLAECYVALGQASLAEAEYDKAIAEEPGNTIATQRAVHFYILNKKSEKAEEILRQRMENGSKDKKKDLQWVRQRLAAILFNKENYQARQEAIKLLEANLAEDSNSTVDKRILARGLAFKGSHEERRKSRALLEELVQLSNPENQDSYILAKLLLTENDWSGASGLIQQLLTSDKINPDWLSTYIQALIRRQAFGDAQRVLDQYKQLTPNTFSSYYIQSQIDVGRGQIEQGLAKLKAFLVSQDAEPKGTAMKLALVAQAAETLANQNSLGTNPEEARKTLLEQAEEWYRDLGKSSPNYKMVLAGFLGKQGKALEAISMTEQNWRFNRPTTIASTTVRLLSVGEPTADQIKRVEKLINDATVRYGKVPPMLLAKAELRIIQKKYEDAEQLYRQVVEKDPNNVVALNNLAVFLALRGVQLDESLDLINRAFQQAGSIGALLDSRAMVHLARGDWESALEDMKVALADEPSGTRYFHLAQALLMGGKKQEAQEAFQKSKDFGLTVDQLQPIERPSYRKLREALQQ